MATLNDEVTEAIAVIDGLEPALDKALGDSGDGVNFVAKGDKTVILKSGFEATADRQAPSPLGQVQNFSMTMGDQAGEADWHCDRLDRSGGYQGQWTLTPGVASSWQPLAIDFPQRSQGVFTGLPSGQVVTTRLRGTGGTTGHGEWSALASCLVP